MLAEEELQLEMEMESSDFSRCSDLDLKIVV